MPALIKAQKDVKNLNKSDIGEMRGYKAPPGLVGPVCNAVMLMLGHKQNWSTAQSQMKNAAEFK